MKQAEDTKTVELFPVPGRRGRPVTGEGKTSAQRQAIRRARLKEAGVVSLTVTIPADLHQRLVEFVQFKDMSKDKAVEKFLRQGFRPR